MAVIISDFLGPINWMRPLRAISARHEVLGIEIIDPRDVELPPVGDVVLQDTETARTREFKIDEQLRADFERAAAAHRADVARTFRRCDAPLLTLRTEKKLLPTTVVNQVTRARAAEIEEQQGYKPGRKQLKELKEQVTEELLPRAFSIRRDTRVWIDPDNGWLAIDAAAAAKADEVRGMLFKALDPLPLVNLHVNQSPVAAMTEWLAGDAAPGGFTVDQEIELQSGSESKATVRYVRHPLDPEDLRRHIAAGKRCTRLAMTWNDRLGCHMSG